MVKMLGNIENFPYLCTENQINYVMEEGLFKGQEIVKIRTRSISNGKRNIFLEYMVNGKQKQEYLKLHLLPETDKASKNKNAETMKLANTIRAKRTMELIEERSGIKMKKATSKMLFTSWVKSFRAEKEKTCRGKEYVLTIDNVTKHLVKYRGAGIKMMDIDKDFCVGFVEYLKTATTRWGDKELSKVTQKVYFTMLNSMLKQAVQDGIIAQNPVDLLKRSEKVKASDTERVYLDLSEVKKLSYTDCKSELVKQAFMFSCFCGLRISDIRKLEWKDIEVVTDRYGNETYRLSSIMQKTQRKVSYALSNEAMKWLPEKGDSPLVFDGLNAEGTINSYIKKWAKDAGITKNVSFHTARHTFATMMLTLGADLYTTSKLLGHTNIATTQIYAKIIDKKKDEAMGLIDKFFG